METQMIMGLDVVEVVMLALGGTACIGASILLYIARREDQQDGE